MELNAVDNQLYFPLDSWDYNFHERFKYPRTNLSTAALSVTNLTWLLAEVGTQVGNRLNRKIIIVPTNRLYGKMVIFLQNSSNHVDLQNALNYFNRHFLESETLENYEAYREGELFYKWAVFKDRDVYLDPPLIGNGRRRWNSLNATGYYNLDNTTPTDTAIFVDQEQYAQNIDDCQMPAAFKIATGEALLRDLPERIEEF